MFESLGSLWDMIVVSPMTSALLTLFGALSVAGIGSWGLTIIVFTLLVRTITLPLAFQQMRSAKAMQALQPELEALRRQYGKDREKLVQAQMELYRERGVNPMAGCLPLVIQMPIWIGLYTALLNLSHRGDFASGFLWLSTLAQPDPFYILAVLSGITGFLAQKASVMPTSDPQQQQMQSMMQFMPLLYVFFALQVPAGLVLYWVVSNVFTFIQQGTILGWRNINLGFVGLTPSTATASPSGRSGGSRTDGGARTPAPTPSGREILAARANGRAGESAERAENSDRATPDRPSSTRRRKRRR